MKIKLKPIVQQVIVVTGATSGIGLETARRFARLGARLVLVGRDQAELDETLAEVRGEGADGITVLADVADWEQVKLVAERAIEAFGRIDTWVNVAGVAYYAKIEDTKPDEFRRVIDVNLNGPMHGILAALPYIKKQGRGAIITVSSVNARIPLPFQGAYVASKHGLDGMINTLRLELEHDGVPISITSVIPATINTPFFAKAKTRIGVKPNAMQPVYTPAAVADAIVYAAEHPVKELTIGSAAIVYQAMNRFNRNLFGLELKAVAFKGQRTNKRKNASAPNNLFEHVEGFRQSEGEWKPAMYSKLTWLQTHPTVRYALMAVLLLVPAGYLAYRRTQVKAQRRPLQNVAHTGEALLSQVTTAAAGLMALIASRRKQPLPQRIVRQVRRTLPDHLPSIGHQQSTAEKFLSKAGDLVPKGLTLFHKETIPEKMLRMVKNTLPKELFRRSQPNLVKRVARATSEAVEPVAEIAARVSKQASKAIDGRKQKPLEAALENTREMVNKTIERI